MATRTKPTADIYSRDFYVWTERQAALLRAQRFEQLDLDNLIEEVEALGRAELNAVLSNAGVIVEHLLKLEHSRAQDPRAGWRATIREHRRHLRRELTPRFRRMLQDELPGLYPEIRDDTAALLRDYGEHDATDTLPEACPYALDRITGDWLP